MNVETITDRFYDFYLQYPLFCYGIGIIILLFAIWKPRKVLKSVLTLLVLALILYFCSFLVDSINFGAGVKEKAIHRTEKGIVE